VQLHLAGNPASVEVRVPPALHGGVRRSVLVGRSHVGNTEIALQLLRLLRRRRRPVSRRRRRRLGHRRRRGPRRRLLGCEMRSSRLTQQPTAT